LHTGFWTDDLSSAFALASPAAAMWTHLYQFYGAEFGGMDFAARKSG
jgi:hypothetical protein